MESTFTPIERLRAMKALMAFMESSRFAEFRQETVSGCVDHLFETAPRDLIRELFDEPSMNQFMMANLATEFEIDGEESLVHVFLKSPEVNELSPGSHNFLKLLADSYLRVVEVTEVEEGKSCPVTIVKLILHIINKVAVIAVALVKKLLADLENMKLSCEVPNPIAPPSDFCTKIKMIKTIANMIFRVRKIFSIMLTYSKFS